MIRLRSLFAVVMLFGIYSLLSASIFVVLDAVDVAFTEAAVGAGVSTMLMLATLSMVGHKESKPRHSPVLPLFVVILTGAVLIWGTLDMPMFGDPNAPVHQHVAPRYINDSPTEVGIPNMVTSVLASYRGYDTMGEVTVVFTALIGVIALLGMARADSARETAPDVDSQPVLPVVSKLLIPFILLFALYVQFHGDFGPGGGFQAGVIFAAGIILYTMTFGLKAALRLTPPKALSVLAALGLLIFIGTGIVSLFKGGSFLDYGVLAQDPVHGQHLGILVIELGVGITVSSVMILIFFAFVGRVYERGANLKSLREEQQEGKD